MYPKILSIGFAVPEFGYTQSEIFQRLGYPAGYRRLFNDSGIERRFFWVGLARLPELSFQEQQERISQGRDRSYRPGRSPVSGRTFYGADRLFDV